MKYVSLSTLMSPVDVGTGLAGLEHCRDVSLFPIISDWERWQNRLKRLLSCVGMSKLLEWFLRFLTTMASSHAEDRRLANDGGEVRTLRSIRLLRATRGSNQITSASKPCFGEKLGFTNFGWIMAIWEFRTYRRCSSGAACFEQPVN